MKRRLFCLTTLSLVMMSGCQEMYRVNISGDPLAPLFEPENPLYLGEGATISLGEYNPEINSTTEVWLIEFTQGAKGRYVSGVIYGETPGGFRVLEPKKPLRPDVIYVIHFQVGGGVNAIGYFKIAYQGATPTLLQLKSLHR